MSVSLGFPPKNRRRHFFQLILKIRQIMSVPEMGQFLNGVCNRDLLNVHQAILSAGQFAANNIMSKAGSTGANT